MYVARGTWLNVKLIEKFHRVLDIRRSTWLSDKPKASSTLHICFWYIPSLLLLIFFVLLVMYFSICTSIRVLFYQFCIDVTDIFPSSSLAFVFYSFDYPFVYLPVYQGAVLCRNFWVVCLLLFLFTDNQASYPSTTNPPDPLIHLPILQLIHQYLYMSINLNLSNPQSLFTYPFLSVCPRVSIPFIFANIVIHLDPFTNSSINSLNHQSIHWEIRQSTYLTWY